MFWFIKIAFNKELREKETARRTALKYSNKILMAELIKLKTRVKHLKAIDPNHPYEGLLNDLGLNKSINTINHVNHVISFLWISDKDVDRLQSFVGEIRSFFSRIFDKLNLYGDMETFINSKTTSIFSKPVKFTNSDVFSKLLNTAQLSF